MPKGEKKLFVNMANFTKDLSVQRPKNAKLLFKLNSNKKLRKRNAGWKL